jgi:hypothetical protein
VQILSFKKIPTKPHRITFIITMIIKQNQIKIIITMTIIIKTLIIIIIILKISKH